MAGEVRFTCGDVSMTATLNGSASAEAVLAKLPVEGLIQTYGREVYFFIDLTLDDENATEDTPVGTVAFWPAGSAICIFFGQKPVSPVNVIGQLDGDSMMWRDVISGSEIRMERV